MIRYALKCEQGHSFESWFQSAAAFDQLLGGGHLACVTCGSTDVSKAIMAPVVAPSRGVAPPAAEPEAHAALQKMRKHVEDNASYVGSGFVKEARDMHLGDAPERAIYGEAKIEEAKALIDDGVPVVPLPFIPKAKAN